MNPHVETEAHSSGHSLLSWLQPDRNPFYLITLACVTTVTLSTLLGENYIEPNWSFLFGIVAIVLVLNLLLSLIPQQIERYEYDRNLRFARSFGITVATGSMLLMHYTFTQGYKPLIFIMILSQVVVFSAFLIISLIKKETFSPPAKRVINNFQLCLTTSSLLIGFLVNYNLYLKTQKAELKLPLYISKEMFNDTIQDIRNQLTRIQKMPLENFYKDRKKHLNEETVSSLKLDLNVIDGKLKDLQPSKENLSAKNRRHLYICYLLGFGWLLCMLVWLYQLKDVIAVKVNLESPPD
jgi:hypothetical protein